jgi:asparagine synthase (glutamine-hydrolysing)
MYAAHTQTVRGRSCRKGAINMCRIFGYFGHRQIDSITLDAVSQALIHGGPDAQTVHRGDTWALGNNRLAIQGIANGNQPFFLRDMACVFNGEIYNHRALRKDLINRGYKFIGDCDGDVILPLYELYGDAFVSKLEGMFAIALVDTRDRRCLKLFVDHAGMKSLYYYTSSDGTGLYFASELVALSLFPGFPAEVDPCAIDHYFGGRAVWGPGTIYKNVCTLTPGSMLQFSPDEAVMVRHITELPTISVPDNEPDSAGSTLDQLLRDELINMLDADVPACVITSGGLDSSYLTALAAALLPNVSSFNVAYAGTWPSDERHFAEEVARHCRTNHHQVLLNPDEFPNLVDRFVRHLDQPNNAPHSLSTFGLFEAVHQAGFKIALTGDGADELFGGYARYANAAQDCSEQWHRSYQKTMAVTETATLSRLYSGDFRKELKEKGGYFADINGDRLLVAAKNNAHGKLESILRYDQIMRFPYYILRRVDHLSMAHAVEARIPFLQPRIVKFSHGLSADCKVVNGAVKKPVVDAARQWLPSSILDRPKQPFTLPIAAMIRPGERLYDLVGDVLLGTRARCADYFDRAVINELLAIQTQHASQHAAGILWSLLVLEKWLSVRNLTP